MEITIQRYYNDLEDLIELERKYLILKLNIL